MLPLVRLRYVYVCTGTARAVRPQRHCGGRIMDAVCARGELACEMRALAAALHSLHLYCATISAALICCCAPLQPHWFVLHFSSKRWLYTTNYTNNMFIGCDHSW